VKEEAIDTKQDKAKLKQRIPFKLIQERDAINSIRPNAKNKNQLLKLNGLQTGTPNQMIKQYHEK
jgi:hypothetical protein